MSNSLPLPAVTGGSTPFEDPERPLALLVDGDNASAPLISQVLDEAAKYGTSIIRRVYGDWTSPYLNSWKLVLQAHALTPSQQFANTAGKNSTDSSLIIDAMDILHGGRVRGFCIVSSDSDYTRLAIRIREEGTFVMGIGKAQTPAAFRNACNVFVAIENLSVITSTSAAQAGTSTAHLDSEIPERAAASGHIRPPFTVVPRRPPSEASDILVRAFETVVREDGRAHLATLGAALLKLDPAFDPRTYGSIRLLTLIQRLPDDFELDRPDELSDPRIYVRVRAKVSRLDSGAGPV